jgi:hypothetical protein
VGQACKARRSSEDMYLRDDIDAIVSSGAENITSMCTRPKESKIHVHMTVVLRKVAGFRKPSDLIVKENSYFSLYMTP